MINPIARVKLNDKTTWIESNPIALSAWEILKFSKRLIKNDYFSEKKILILPIDDTFDLSYREILDEGLKEIRERDNLILTSGDCVCYLDRPSWCDEELECLLFDNKELFENYEISIGVLKGHDSHSYEKVRQSLEKKVKAYLIYINRESRSNPRYFSLVKFFQEKFPNGLEKPVFLHGCSFKKLKDIPKLNVEIKGIIISGHLSDAIYRGHKNYKRKTKIKKNWEKWKTAIHNIKT